MSVVFVIDVFISLTFFNKKILENWFCCVRSSAIRFHGAQYYYFSGNIMMPFTNVALTYSNLICIK